MRLTHSALFGDDFYQDSQIIRISKSSLNLQARDYPAEAILVALILRALQPFEGVITGNGQVITGNGKTVTYNNSALYDRLVLFFWQRTFTQDKQGIPVDKRSFVLEIYAPVNSNSAVVSVGDLEL